MQDVKLKGYDIAARTQLVINAFAIGRDPELWDRAEEFWPDRFLNTSIEHFHRMDNDRDHKTTLES